MFRNVRTFVRGLPHARAVLRQMRLFWRGYTTWRFHKLWATSIKSMDTPYETNPLRLFFEAHKEGPGIWKWQHYFDIYDRHLDRFRDRAVRVLEIGIYSGGSLEMWKNYFGPRCEIYGVDIEPACKAYQNGSVKVFIGDQGDRSFWRRFKHEVQYVDIIIDDGGHLPHQQIVTLEELLPHLRPGGVYICEDIHGTLNPFAAYVYGLAQNLNAGDLAKKNADNSERCLVYGASAVQSAVRSIHLYPFVTVVERTETAISELVSTKHGTQWQPFLK